MCELERVTHSGAYLKGLYGPRTIQFFVQYSMHPLLSQRSRLTTSYEFSRPSDRTPTEQPDLQQAPLIIASHVRYNTKASMPDGSKKDESKKDKSKKDESKKNESKKDEPKQEERRRSYERRRPGTRTRPYCAHCRHTTDHTTYYCPYRGRRTE